MLNADALADKTMAPTRLIVRAIMAFRRAAHFERPATDTTVITILRAKTPTQVHSDVAGFAEQYVRDWERWLLASAHERPKAFVKTLGRWQATRPAKLRRLRVRAGEHPPPYIEDLLTKAAPHLHNLVGFSVGRAEALDRTERTALEGLWNVFSSLQQVGIASCVAITKAILLLSDGRIGPAFDSQVRKKLRLNRLLTSADWIAALSEVSDDIRAFEGTHGVSLPSAVPPRFSTLAYGRLYDMALGPRNSKEDVVSNAATMVAHGRR